MNYRVYLVVQEETRTCKSKAQPTMPIFSFIKFYKERYKSITSFLNVRNNKVCHLKEEVTLLLFYFKTISLFEGGVER
jgi:hypothetical protein